MANALSRHPCRKRTLILCFSQLLFHSVPSENWLLFAEGQFLHLENEGKKPAFPFLGGCPQQASREGMGPGLESWLTAALTLRGHRRPSAPRGSRRTQLHPEFGVPCFPLICLVQFLVFKTQLRCDLLQEVFLSRLRVSAHLPPPGSLST